MSVLQTQPAAQLSSARPMADIPGTISDHAPNAKINPPIAQPRRTRSEFMP
jgi:hypothetical protein